MSGDDEMDVYRERLGDALHRVAHPHHPWSGCAYPDLFYDKLTHFMGDLAASGLTVRPALLADTPSVEPLDAAWKEAESALIAAQGDDDGFGVEIAYWSEFPDEPWSVAANEVQVEAARLPDALRKLAALLPTQASDSPEKQ